MKVTHLTSWLSNLGGGIPAVIAPLCRGLAMFPDIQPTVLGLSENENFRSDQDWGSLPVVSRRPIDRGLIGFSPHLIKDLFEAAPSAVHVHGLWTYASIACTQWASRTGRPYVVSPHGMLESWALHNSRWKKRLASLAFQRLHLRKAACLHALNQAELDDIRTFGLDNPVAVIPNGVEVPRTADRSDAPWSFQVPKRSKVLLFLGRLHPKKNIPGLVRAWARVSDVVGDESWTLVIAGWDQLGHAAEIQNLVWQLGLGSSVHLVGPQFGTHKTETFRRADAFVLPSMSEGLPVAVLEAWSYSLPVLMTRACNLPEGFDAGAAIEIPEEEESMAQFLAAFLRAEPDALARMGAAGKRLVGSRYSWPTIAISMAELYRWIERGGEPPAFVSQ